MTTIERLVAFRDQAPRLEQGAMVALTLLALTFAFESVRPLLSLPGMVLTNVEVVLLLAVGLWLLACVAAGRRPWVPRAVAPAAVAWLSLLLLSALAAADHRTDALKFAGRMTSGVLVGWAVYDLAHALRRWRTLVRALALGGLAVAIFGLAEAAELPAVGRFLALFKEAPTVVGELLRVSSTLVYATITSMVLEMAVPLLLAWVLTAKRGWARALLGAGLLATLTAQVLTLTRSGVIALLAALGLMGAWAAWHCRWNLVVGSLVTAGMLLAVGGAVLFWKPATQYRLASETEQKWYQATYQAPPRLTARAGETLFVPLTLLNTGVRTWQTSGPHPFRLGYHLASSNGSSIDFDGSHIPLPHDVAPGTSIDVRARLIAPALAGEYIVEWDMLQEDVTWFAWEGSPPAQTQLTVLGTVAAGAAAVVPQEGARLSPDAAEIEGQGRLWLWQVAAGMFLKRPLLGVGPDNFRWLHTAYAGLGQGQTRTHTNNLYIEWLVNTGILGFAAFLWLMWRVVQMAYRVLLGDWASKSQLIWRWALLGSLAVWFVHGLFDYFYEFMPTYLAFSMICGLVLARTPLSGQEGQPCASDTM